MMFAQALENLPRVAVRRILLMRTAPTPQVQWAIQQLKAEYPEAELSILGSQLDHNLFAGMRKFQITQPWLNQRTYRPFHREVKKAHFDVVVMCLNTDSFAGYGHVSRVMKRIPAEHKLVADYAGVWYDWKHELFQEGNWVTRWAMAVLEFALLPFVFLIVAAMPSRKSYMPAGQGRPAPGYDR